MKQGIVLRVYKNGDVPLCDIMEPTTGATYVGCPFAARGAGTEDDQDMSVAPPGSSVLFLMYQGACTQAIVVGVLGQPGSGKGAVAEVEQESGRDYPVNARALLDRALLKGGAVLLLTTDGRIVLDTKQSMQPLMVQLAAGTPMRISQGGEEPTERVLLAGPTRAEMDSYVQRMNDLQKALKDSLALIVAASGASTDPGFQAAGKALAESVQVLTVMPPLLDTSDSLLASAILLSADAASAPIIGPDPE